MVVQRSRRDIFYDDFALFLERPSRDRLRKILTTHGQETDNLDFKREWPSASKLAKHVLAIANSGGGCIVVGVNQSDDGTLSPIGMKGLIDKADVTRGMAKYLPAPLIPSLQVVDFHYDASEYEQLIGKRFQVLFIDDDIEHIPFIAMADGDGISQATIYVRRGTSSEPTKYDELQRLVTRRIESGYSSTAEMDIRSELAQLKELYSTISPTIYNNDTLRVIINSIRSPVLGSSAQNPDYPEERLDEFVARMIRAKKVRIARLIGLSQTDLQS